MRILFDDKNPEGSYVIGKISGIKNKYHKISIIRKNNEVEFAEIEMEWCLPEARHNRKGSEGCWSKDTKLQLD